jgi:hypothetical protein
MPLINLAGRFVLELIAIGAVGYWGFQVVGAGPLRIGVAVGAAAVFLVIWRLVVAPKADNAIPGDIRVLIGSFALLLAASALALAGEAALAVAYAVAVAVNTVILFWLEHDVPGTLARSA